MHCHRTRQLIVQSVDGLTKMVLDHAFIPVLNQVDKTMGQIRATTLGQIRLTKPGTLILRQPWLREQAVIYFQV
jgi:hypothetical protein